MEKSKVYWWCSESWNTVEVEFTRMQSIDTLEKFI